MVPKEILLKWQHDKNFQLEQVKRNGFAIQFIINPSERVQLEAVKEDGHSICFIHNPSFEVCNEALKNTKNDLDDIIRYIDVVKYPELYEKYCFMKR